MRAFLLWIAGAAACSAPRLDTGAVVTEGAVVPRPDGCRSLSPGAPLQAAIDGARSGEALCLEPGTYSGPILLSRPITVWGPRDAVIRSRGAGTTVALTGHGIHIAGFTVDGSGGRFDLLDAAVHVEGDDHIVRGLQVINATFGILVEQASRVTVRDNVVIGAPHRALGLRGDGIRLWETRDSIIEHNLVRHSRDMVVWYSPRNRIVYNVVEHGRYGTHFMYSHENLVRGNLYLYNVVGIFVMYSRDITLRDNTLAGASGAAGMGIGIKDSGNIVAEDNRLLHDTVGIYLDTSPLQLAHSNRFQRNLFWMCRQGVTFHSSPTRTTFAANAFSNNASQITVEGRGDALGVTWDGNYFDDYQGYDLDDDGRGDVPYTLRSIGSDLQSTYPQLRFFTGTPALGLAEAVGLLVPLFEPKLILRDEAPRMVCPVDTKVNDEDRARQCW